MKRGKFVVTGALTFMLAATSVGCGAADVDNAEQTDNADQSLTGVKGHIDSFIVEGTNIAIQGWTFNATTVPVQEVSFLISGKTVDGQGRIMTTTLLSATVIANVPRPDVQSTYHLTDSLVGYQLGGSSALGTTNGDIVGIVPTGWRYKGPVTACGWARDRQTDQKWLQFDCKTIDIQ